MGWIGEIACKYFGGAVRSQDIEYYCGVLGIPKNCPQGMGMIRG